MRRKLAPGIISALLLIGMLNIAFLVQPIKVKPESASTDHCPTSREKLDTTEQTTLLAPETDLINRNISIIDAKTGIDSITLGSPTVPIPSGGYPFAISVTLNGATDYLHSFQVAVAFNKSKVNCTAAWIPRDDPNFVFYEKSPIMGFVSVHNEKGFVALGSSLSSDYVIPDHTLPHYVNVSGEKLLCQINFTAIEEGTSALEIIRNEEYVYPWNTLLMDINNQTIDFTSKKFSVTAFGLRPEFVKACIHIQPHALNLRSRGKWITAYIRLPEGYDVADINVSSILLNNTISAELRPIAVGDCDNDDVSGLMVKFDRTDVISYILNNVDVEKRFMKVTLTVTGYLIDGTPFQGSDTIIVMFIPRGFRFCLFLFRCQTHS